MLNKDNKICLLFLFQYVKKYKMNFSLFYLGWLFDTVLCVLMPILFGIMIDQVVYYNNLHAFLQIAFFYVTITLLSCIIYFLIYAQHHYITNNYVLDIRMDLFKSIQSLKAKTIMNKGTGELITLLLPYTEECMFYVIRNYLRNFNNLLLILFFTLYVFVIDWKIGIVVTVGILLNLLLSNAFGKKMRKNHEAYSVKYNGYVSWLYEKLSSLMDIRMLGSQRLTTHKLIEKHRKLFNIKNKNSVVSLTASNLMNLTNLCVQLLIYVLVGFMAAKGDIMVGTFVVVVALYSNLSYSLTWFTRIYLDGQENLTHIKMVMNLMDEEKEESWPGTETLHIAKGTVEIDNLSFGYNNALILKNLNLHIDNGDHIAIVGTSGCGKTTLASLLVGLFEPNGGKIKIGEQDITECTLKSIRTNIGIVQQEVLIFNGTILENIQLSNRTANIGQVQEACRLAGLTELINGLPEGLNTVYGQKGIDFSGGEKQRIAIARTLLKNPNIIIFDEATASLDNETESNILKDFNNAFNDKTAIIITHRLNSVLSCNKVALMKDGEISAVDTPQNLMANNEYFKEIFKVRDKEEDKDCD